MIHQLPAVNQHGAGSIQGAPVIILAQLPGADHVQLSAGVNDGVGEIFAQGNFPGIGHIHPEGVHHGIGHGAVNIHGSGPEIFPISEKTQIQDHGIGIGIGFMIDGGALHILDHQGGAHIRTQHHGHVFTAHPGELDHIGQVFVIGGMAVPVDDMQLRSRPGGHHPITAGETGIFPQGIAPSFAAPAVQAKEGHAVIIEQAVAKGGHILGGHAAKLHRRHFPGAAAEYAKQRQGDQNDHGRQGDEDDHPPLLIHGLG